MNKYFKIGIAGTLSLVMLTGFAGCKKQSYDPETRAMTMAIGAIDGNFNPFFYTAQNDGTVAGMTQVSMLSTDSNGNLVCGEDYPTVVKEYTIASYDANGNEISQESAKSDTTDHTTYSFLLKNGMKFSDGEDLTIMDVLFSMYVELDMQYTGSATLYSNDIQGLKAYRQQDPEASDDSNSDFTSGFIAEAQTRINDMIDYSNGNATLTDQISKDIEAMKTLYKEELLSDWTDVEESFGSRDLDNYEYNFTEVWQAYFLNENVIAIKTALNSNGAYEQLKNSDGTYMTDLDDEGNAFEEIANEGKNDTELINSYISQGNSEENAIELSVRDHCVEYIHEAKTQGTGIAEILQYWATGDTILEQFTGEARSAYYEEKKQNNNGELLVPTVSGIKAYRVNTFNGKQLDDTYSELQITINGVDPKAEYNFAFNVCPMHYYSGTYDGVNYVQQAMDDYEAFVSAGVNGNYEITHFGVDTGIIGFFSDVLQDTDKNGLPLGAGAYMPADSTGEATTNRNAFYVNKYVYYVRNPYFYTTGENIENAKLKNIQYREMSDNSIINSLVTGEIDYGMPAATTANQQELAGTQDLDSSTLYQTNGYGYIGINPKYVPDHEVRQAIMKAMNTSEIVKNYYTESFAETLYRPMSKTNWVYDYFDNNSSINTEYSEIKYTTDGAEIEKLVQDAGYTKNSDGIYAKGDTKCKITFTIAGETTDHPAYDMMQNAAALLNEHGFDITVKTDSTALSKLASGNLEVWAAAWTSTIDPDMYQVYHKDSTASSVKNWNYQNILVNQSAGDYEYDTIMQLSDLIDDARSINNRSERAAIYSDALDLVMHLAVELPTYQRMDNEVYNKDIISRASLNKTPSCYSTLIDRIWEVTYN